MVHDDEESGGGGVLMVTCFRTHVKVFEVFGSK